MTKRLLAVLAASLLPLCALAQGYPNKPIRIVVPLAAAGTGDTLARAVGEAMAKELGQPVVIENKPGAGGLVGTQFVAAAAPDGYTLLAVSPSHVINATLYAKADYDPVKSFEPITLMAYTHQVLVANPATPFNTLKELIDYARKNPGKLNYGSAGTGSATHLNMELFKSMAGVDIVHVPYKGSSGARTDMLGGQVQMMFDAITTMAPHVQAGKLRALGTSGKARSSVLPDTPTVAEAGVPGYEAVIWLGIMAPAGTPKAIVERLNAEITKAAGSAEMRAAWAKQGAVAMTMSPGEFDKYLHADIEKWARIVKISGARPDQ